MSSRWRPASSEVVQLVFEPEALQRREHEIPMTIACPDKLVGQHRLQEQDGDGELQETRPRDEEQLLPVDGQLEVVPAKRL
jgi:hypothetical protein